jgi:type II restriction enzyme
MKPFNEYTITSSRIDDEMLTNVTKNVCNALREKYLCAIPDTWDFECNSKKISFKDIKQLAIASGMPEHKVNMYYGENSSIISDAYIIYLNIYKNENDINRYPLFIGEIKKQGTNDIRMKNGKPRQAQGNAGTDRVSKNFIIASDYCYLIDRDFFPYTVFLHGCDFGVDEISKTTKSKLSPLFGELNKFNPHFDKDMLIYLSQHKGGTCYYQKEVYTYKQLFEACYNCCDYGINHYLSKYGK